jgi:hypothetical protein
MEIPATNHPSFCKSPDGRHPVQRFLLLGPLTGVLVGYAQVTVAVIVWVLHGEPGFYFRGGQGVILTYLGFTIGGGIVGVAYGALLMGLECLTHRRIRPIIALGLILAMASIIAAVFITKAFHDRTIVWVFAPQVCAVVLGILVSMAVSKRIE